MLNRLKGAAGLLLIAGMLSASLAEPADAAGRGRGGERGNRGERRYEQPRRSEQRNRGPERREYRGQRGRGRGHSEFWPFLGGVVLGTVIGSHHDAPPPPRHVRSVIFVYDCDWCDFRCRSYDDFTSHLVCDHRIPRCDVGRWFQPNEHGYWEDNY